MVEGRCQRARCLRLITHRSPSPWFCSELCARIWHRAHAPRD